VVLLDPVALRTPGTAARGVPYLRLISLLGVALFAALWVRDWGAVFPRLFDSPMITALDYHIYIDATSRFLQGGSFYDPRQLSGPYGAEGTVQGWWPILYPPQAIALFAPFTVLPAALWWAIPLATTAAVVVWHRPQPIAWPVLAACLWWPVTTTKIATGNPVMWTVAFVALGTIWRWPAVLALFKPSLFPFALIGWRDRRWWILGALGALPFCWLLPDYLRAMSLFTSGISYSLGEVPLMLIPVVAWVASRRRAPWTLRATRPDPRGGGKP
jgi:hypothetical protein